jgi:excisionase family DNA binding protein
MKKTIGQATAYDVDGAAEALDLVPETIRTMIRDGRLPAHKVGRKWWVTEETLEAALEGRLPRQQAKYKPVL